jgi:hypothetical protein
MNKMKFIKIDFPKNFNCDNLDFLRIIEELKIVEVVSIIHSFRKTQDYPN